MDVLLGSSSHRPGSRSRSRERQRLHRLPRLPPDLARASRHRAVLFGAPVGKAFRPSSDETLGDLQWATGVPTRQGPCARRGCPSRCVCRRGGACAMPTAWGEQVFVFGRTGEGRSENMTWRASRRRMAFLASRQLIERLRFRTMRLRHLPRPPCGMSLTYPLRPEAVLVIVRAECDGKT